MTTILPTKNTRFKKFIRNLNLNLNVLVNFWNTQLYSNNTKFILSNTFKKIKIKNCFRNETLVANMTNSFSGSRFHMIRLNVSFQRDRFGENFVANVALVEEYHRCLLYDII